MAYKYSNEDKKNLFWFDSDHTRQSLRRINLTKGTLRGLRKFDVQLDFPITAIAGLNGSGKSTLLAIAACAFHNLKTGHKFAGRHNSYYTFSDFFVQSKDEIPPQGIELWYHISHDSWRNTDPKAKVGKQKRWKSEGGKWNNYDKRVKRNVAYFGVQRVVPHFERSAHKSYRARFKSAGLDDNVKKNICEIASKIIGKHYDEFDSHEHSKYSLPQVTANGVQYSGFNMGAGESAVFEILTTLFSIGEGALLVIDEIELGLHEKAQYRFIEELKKLCLKLKCQIICSTHSYAVLSSLPPEGRLFIEAGTTSTTITTGVSADFACGKMGGTGKEELDVFVEDGIAHSVLQKWLPNNIKQRINIFSIGSHSAVIRQLVSRYLEKKHECFCILDGDQRTNNSGAIKKLLNYAELGDEAEREKAKKWADERIKYLPSDKPPERWLLESTVKKIKDGDDAIADSLIELWGLENPEELLSFMEEALNATSHSEFYVLAKSTNIKEETVLSDVIRSVKKFSENDLKEMVSYFEDALPTS